MDPISRKILSSSLAKETAVRLFSKKRAPLCLSCVFHSEAVQDKAVFTRLKEFAAGLSFRPLLCIMTPRNPYIRREMERLGVSEEEFAGRVKELSASYDIGFHGHWCRPPLAGASAGPFKPGKPTRIEQAGLELTLNDPAGIAAQFEAEYGYLRDNFGPPAAYSAGWWFLDPQIVSLLDRFDFGLDCSVRYKTPDSFGREQLPGASLPRLGRPFFLPGSAKVAELPSLTYLHMNWWTVLRSLRPLLAEKDAPMFASLPLHDYNLQDDGGKTRDNIALLSRVEGLRWVSAPEARSLMLEELRVGAEPRG